MTQPTALPDTDPLYRLFEAVYRLDDGFRVGHSYCPRAEGEVEDHWLWLIGRAVDFISDLLAAKSRCDIATAMRLRPFYDHAVNLAVAGFQLMNVPDLMYHFIDTNYPDTEFHTPPELIDPGKDSPPCTPPTPPSGPSTAASSD